MPLSDDTVDAIQRSVAGHNALPPTRLQLLVAMSNRIISPQQWLRLLDQFYPLGDGYSRCALLNVSPQEEETAREPQKAQP